MDNKQTAYLLARLTMGVNFLGHGLVRIPKLTGFRDWMLGFYEGTMMPAWLVAPFATVLPLLEFSIGLLLILSLFTRQTLIAGALVMIVLIFGSCMKENWEAVGSQMVYALFFFVLIFSYEYNPSWISVIKKS